MATTYQEEATYQSPENWSSEVVSEAVTFQLAEDYDNNTFQDQQVWFDPNDAGAEQSVSNRVWDTVAGTFVRWSTALIDTSGESYPGPGTFGVDTSNFVVETIEFTRS